MSGSSITPGRPATAQDIDYEFSRRLINSLNLGDLTNPALARQNLGLGSWATQSAGAVNITGGTIDDTPIGGTTPAYGRFVALIATGLLTASASLVVNGTLTGTAIAALLSSPLPIGDAAPNSGAFTTLSASGAVTGAGFTARFASPGPIGSTAPSTGAFTNLNVSGTLSGAAFAGLDLTAPGPIGSVTPNTGAFTALSAAGAVTGVGFQERFATPGPIGSAEASTGAFTTLSASGTVSGAGFTARFASPGPIGSTAASSGAFTTISATGTLSVAGAVSGAGVTALMASPGPIGSTAASTGAFTTLSASGTVSGAGFSTYVATALAAPTAIGSGTPNTGVFTTLGATGTTTLGNGLANYVVITGAANTVIAPATTIYPTATVIGAGTDLDLRVLPKGAGYLSALKLFTGSDVVRAGINTATQVYLRTSATVTGVNVPMFFAGGIYSGTPSGGDIALHAFQSAETIVGGVTGTTVLHEVNANGSGGRTAFSARLQINGKPNSTASAFLVGAGLTARAFSSYNGSPGNHIGSLFGSNNIVRLSANAGAEWASVVSAEFDTTMPWGTGADFHIGVSSILHWDNGVNHDVRGGTQDNAFMIGSARNDRATIGWRIGYGYGDPTGWVFNDDSQLIGFQPTVTAYLDVARPYTMADALSTVGVTLKRAALITENMAIDMDGNIGGQTTGGVHVQARDSILAKSAAVASLTALQPDGGGLYYSSNLPYVSISLPPDGFALTVSNVNIAHLGALILAPAIADPGIDYQVGDVLTMAGGTFTTSAQITVRQAGDLGELVVAEVTRAGVYTVLPSNPVTFTGGSGTDFEYDLNSGASWEIATHGAAYGLQSIVTAGVDYEVGDVLTQTGGTGTEDAQVTVVEVGTSGNLRSAVVTRAGSYSAVPLGATSWTGGSGTGFTGTVNYTALTFASIYDGAGYPQYPAPVARFDFGVGATGRQPVIVVGMTATQRQLLLNNGKINVAGMPTSASGLSSGDVYLNANVLTVVP